MSAVRAEVMAELVRVARNAHAEGRDGYDAVKKAYPDVPISIVAEAWCIADGDDVEAWWQAVERTIDGEIVRKAIGGAA